MALEPAAVTSRSNSDLLTIRAIAENVALTTPERMTLILEIAEEWSAATHNSTERHRADKVRLSDHYRTLGIND